MQYLQYILYMIYLIYYNIYSDIIDLLCWSLRYILVFSFLFYIFSSGLSKLWPME